MVWMEHFQVIQKFMEVNEDTVMSFYYDLCDFFLINIYLQVASKRLHGSERIYNIYMLINKEPNLIFFTFIIRILKNISNNSEKKEQCLFFNIYSDLLLYMFLNQVDNKARQGMSWSCITLFLVAQVWYMVLVKTSFFRVPLTICAFIDSLVGAFIDLELVECTVMPIQQYRDSVHPARCIRFIIIPLHIVLDVISYQTNL